MATFIGAVEDSLTLQFHFERRMTDDLLQIIYSYFDVDALLLSSLVNKRWRAIETAQNGAVWEPHVQTLWRRYTVNVPESSILLIDRIRALPLSLVKRALYRVDISRCLEKADFHAMLQARLLLHEVGGSWIWI